MNILQIKEKTNHILELPWVKSNIELYNTFTNSIKLAIDYASKFPAYIPDPNIDYTDDGEIFFTWDINGSNVIFSFLDGEEIGYAYKGQNGDYIPGLYDLKVKPPFDFYSFFN